MKRREFILAGAALAATSLLPETPAWARGRRLRLGMIGTGMRGQVLLKELLRRDDVDMVALCDIEPIMLGRATAMATRAGKPVPRTYGADGDANAWKRLLEQRGLDGVIIATPWELHAPMAIAAMQARVAVGCEVVAGITLQDHWDVLNTQLQTGTPYMLLENVCYRRDVMAALQMVREGLFGELVHLQGGYQHDLRGVKFNDGNPDHPYGSGVEFGMECALRPVTEPVLETAREAAQALAAVEAPLLALARHLEDILDDEAAELDGSQRSRIEGALRGLDRRARMTLPGWRSMLAALEVASDEPDPDFVDWLSAEAAFGRIMDVALRRHWIDPTVPLEAAVVMPAHGVLVTSATLSDPNSDDPFDMARLRTGSARLIEPARTLKVESPFDYAANARVIVVNDLVKDDARQTAAAMRELFLAAGGGGLGLFTAIRRLKAVYERLGPDLAKAGIPLYAQHVDPLEVGALVDVFRAEQDSCLLGTDAVRDGVDVPGRSLRILAFDRVPWPRPDLLHRARRARFGGEGAGGRNFDDALARARMAQAFGRLIRRADDRGVFVMLDAACPTRLFGSLPPGTEVQRMGLAEAVELVGAFLTSDKERP